MAYYVYMLKCADNSYYTGLTTNLDIRIAEHQNGTDPEAYTYMRRPVELAWVAEFPTHDDAFQRERQIKGWSRKKKEALMQNDFDAIQKIVREEKVQRGLIPGDQAHKHAKLVEAPLP